VQRAAVRSGYCPRLAKREEDGVMDTWNEVVDPNSQSDNSDGEGDVNTIGLRICYNLLPFIDKIPPFERGQREP
jgi:hypothetical protein